MADTPCGCDLAADAADIEDELERGIQEAAAREFQCRWRCPRAGFPLPDGTPLPADCADTVVAVGRLTGFRGAGTCPLFYARLDWVNRAARARNWREHGVLRELEGWPSGALCDAIDAVESGVSARQLREHDEAMKRARGPNGSDED